MKMSRLMWLLVVSMALVVSARAPLFALQAATAAPSGTATKEIPVDPETRKKIHAIFVKHAETPIQAWEEARSRLRNALIAGNQAAIEDAKRDFDLRRADVETAKRSISVELAKAGVGKAVHEQEWKTWLAKGAAAKEAKN